MRYLLLAEKPSVMRDIEEVYRKHQSDYSFALDFGAFHGHLMELAMPRDYDPKLQKWTLDDLPIIPKDFMYKEQDAESCRRLLEKIKAGHYDALINSCDAGREGEHIFFSFYEAHNLTVPVLRFWASDTTEPTIRAALNSLKPAAVFDGLRQSAKLRAQLDWMTGINFSRAVSLKTNMKVNIGRVVSPTLKIIVDREREILNFVPKDFFEVQATFSTASGGEYSGTLILPPDYKQTRFDKKADADAIVASLGKSGVIKSIQSKQKSIKAPTLYSIAELQKDGARLFGYSADKTEAIAQSLYEKKLTSYPRTESRFLPTAMVPELKKHLKAVEATPLKAYAAAITQARFDQVTKTKDYVDNAKITDHHAIIPTMEICKDFSALTKDEQNIYLAICKRFLAIFMDPYVVQNTTVFTDVSGKLFKSSGKMEVDKGYTILYSNKSRDVVLPALKEKDAVGVKDSKVKAGQTAPPDRFNVSTLLDAMMNAGNFVSSAESRRILRETAGLGTGATRKDILKKLEDTGMCTVKKTVFCPTQFGMKLIDVIGDREIASPQMTADWEDKLRKVEAGASPDDLSKEMRQYVVSETKDIVNNVFTDLGEFNWEEIGACPACGSRVVEKKNFFLCTNYHKTCQFLIPKSYIGATITKADAKKLLDGKSTGQKTLTTKNKKTMKDCFVLDKDFKVVPSFAVSKKPSTAEPNFDLNKLTDDKVLGKCPACGGKIYEGNKFYLCSNRTVGSCEWSISKKIRGADISTRDVRDLLAGKETMPHQFTWSSGKKGYARMTLENKKLKFLFD